MTARVRAVLEARHEDAGEPRWGWVFPSFDDAKKPTSYNTVKCQHDRTMEALEGLERFTLYAFRHTFLTRLGESDVDAFTIQKIAGHSSITMSQRYVHPTGERIEDALSRLETYNSDKGECLDEESA